MKKLIFTLLLFSIITSAQISMNMNLLGTYNYPTTQGNDIWGWVDSNGNEFAKALPAYPQQELVLLECQFYLTP